MDDSAAERALAEFRHEAANPLALIMSAVRELDRKLPDDDDTRGLLDIANRQVRVLDRLLGRLRGAGDEVRELDLARFDLGALARETVADLRLGILEGRDCDVTVPDGPQVVDGDAIRLRQVLVNLLDNAVTYSPPDTSIHVVVDRDGGQARLRVKDDGEGIAPEDLTAIFQRFQRRTDRPGGLGIGLSVVARIVEAHDGTVEAVPAPDAPGTSFVVRLPLADGTDRVTPA